MNDTTEVPPDEGASTRRSSKRQRESQDLLATISGQARHVRVKLEPVISVKQRKAHIKLDGNVVTTYQPQSSMSSVKQEANGISHVTQPAVQAIVVQAPPDDVVTHAAHSPSRPVVASLARPNFVQPARRVANPQTISSSQHHPPHMHGSSSIPLTSNQPVPHLHTAFNQAQPHVQPPPARTHPWFAVQQHAIEIDKQKRAQQLSVDEIVYPSPPFISINDSVVDSMGDAPSLFINQLAWTPSDDTRLYMLALEHMKRNNLLTLPNTFFHTALMRCLFPGRALNGMGSRWYKVKVMNYNLMPADEFVEKNFEALLKSIDIAFERADLCSRVQTSEPYYPFLTEEDWELPPPKPAIDLSNYIVPLTTRDIELLPQSPPTEFVSWSDADDYSLAYAVSDCLKPDTSVDWIEVACRRIPKRSYSSLLHRWHLLLEAMLSDRISGDVSVTLPYSIEHFSETEDVQILQCVACSLRFNGGIDWDRFDWSSMPARSHKMISRRWNELLRSMIQDTFSSPVPAVHAHTPLPAWNVNEDVTLKRNVLAHTDDDSVINWAYLIVFVYPSRSYEELRTRWRFLLKSWVSQPTFNPAMQHHVNHQPIPNSLATHGPQHPYTHPTVPPVPSRIPEQTIPDAATQLSNWTDADDELLMQLVVAFTDRRNQIHWNQFRHTYFPNNSWQFLRDRWFDVLRPGHQDDVPQLGNYIPPNQIVPIQRPMEKMHNGNDGDSDEEFAMEQNDEDGLPQSHHPALLRTKWSPEQDSELHQAVAVNRRTNGTIVWANVLPLFPERSKEGVLSRWRQYLEPRMLKDQADALSEMGLDPSLPPPSMKMEQNYDSSYFDYSEPSQHVYSRKRGSTRELLPPEQLNTNRFTPEEDALLFRSAAKYRTARGQVTWGEFREQLFPGRTYMVINNRWHNHLKKLKLQGLYKLGLEDSVISIVHPEWYAPEVDESLPAYVFVSDDVNPSSQYESTSQDNQYYDELNNDHNHDVDMGYHSNGENDGLLDPSIYPFDDYMMLDDDAANDSPYPDSSLSKFASLPHDSSNSNGDIELSSVMSPFKLLPARSRGEFNS